MGVTRRGLAALVGAALACGDGAGGSGEATTIAASSSTGADVPTSPTQAFTDSSQPTEGASSTTGPATPHVCEASGLCFGAGSCAECSLAYDCSDEYMACVTTPGDQCVSYANCSSGCAGDEQCVQGCNLQYPDGYDPAWALTDCYVCSVCPGSCSAFSEYCAAGGGGPGKTETCDELGDCGACAGCSAFKGCNPEAVACTEEPQCGLYRQCLEVCGLYDVWCYKFCEVVYPLGYAASWKAYDCALCSACPSSCAAQADYCAAGGGGTGSVECVKNQDCVESWDARPFCVEAKCHECLANADCLDPALPSCQGGFCS